jgi:hypothetical protein
MYTPMMINANAQFAPMYENARSRARWNKFSAMLHGSSNRLLNLNELKQDSQVASQHYSGTQAVPINQIKGSASRNKNFDSEFNPVRDNNRDRWINIIAARLGDKGLPAVDLIKVGDTYFVRDGHHRVSVAKALKSTYIDAHVTELVVEGS